MSISDFHASHIGRVAVSFQLSSPNLDPDEVTSVLGIAPELVSKSAPGFWSISSQGKIEGGLAAKDINEHLRYLLGHLLPVRELIVNFAKEVECYFDVLWESSYLYAGTGPVIADDCIVGISQLNAGIGFDIYQIEAIDPKQTFSSEGEAEQALGADSP